MNSEEAQLVAREIVELPILAGAPEREDDLQQIWKDYDPAFYLLSDCQGLTIRTIKHRVEFDSKTLGFIWICGFTAWRMFCCHSPHVLVSLASDKRIAQELLNSDDGFREAEAGFDELLYTLRTIKDVSTLDEIWPDSVPKPQADKTGFDIEQQATFDVIMIATAYIFLHEIQHVIFNHDGNRPESPVEEEKACDAFACAFLLDDAAAYASDKCVPPEAVIMKRAMGLALGAFIIFEMTPVGGRAGNRDYPPIANRLRMLIADREASADNDYWFFAAAILIAVLRRHNRAMELPSGDPKSMCSALIEELGHHLSAP